MGGQLTPVQLAEVLRAEQRERWQAGDRVSAEALLAHHPTLQNDEDGAAEVVYNEVLLREERGETPQLADYLKRFPHLAVLLRPLFAIHEANLTRLLEHEETPALVGEGQHPAAPAAPNVPGYEVLGELGRGGMGVVYKARQEGLNRLVALKMIRAGAHAGPEEVARLRAEAETQARLQHPNIVQIFEVGEAAGHPYLVLEFVDGGGLDKRLAGVPQPAPAAARLVETLARAVHAAHQQGLVHRDLKPANILLQGSGIRDQGSGIRAEAENLSSRIPDPQFLIPKISDFGLAKRLLDPAGQTQSNPVVGTPSYMAPEQAGGGGRVGPAADVYALGAILYECLTGRPPFLAETPLDTLQQVREQEPVSVRRLQPRVPRDLETVCHKCLQKDPRQRYPDAAALADDLGRFLAGQPIWVRPISTAERFGRWCRRRPLVAGLLALLVLVFAGGFAGVAVQYHRAQTHLEESERQRERARRRFDQVFELAGVFIHDFHDKIADLPGSTPAREFLVQKALTALDGLAGEADDDPKLLDALAHAYAKIAEVQGNPFRPNLGDTAGALVSYRKSLDLTHALVAAVPDDIQARCNLAMRYHYFGDVQLAAGQTGEALASYQAKLDLQEALARAAPADAQAQRDFVYGHDLLGQIRLRLGQRSEALNHFRIGRDILIALTAAPAFRDEEPRSQAVTHYLIGRMHLRLDQPEEALTSYQQRHALLEGLAATAPDSGSTRRELADSHERLGDLHRRLAAPPKALASYQAGHALREQLARTDPHRGQFQRDLAASWERLGDFQAEQGAAGAALACYEKGLDVREALARIDPSNAQGRSDLAAGHHRLADLHARAGRPAEALACALGGRAILEALTQADPRNTQVRRDLAASHAQIGRVQAKLGMTADALQSHRANLALLVALARDDPRNVRARRDLAGSHDRLGQLYAQLGQTRAILDHYRCALAVRQEVAAADPLNVQTPLDLAVAWYQLGGVLSQVGANARDDRRDRLLHWREARRCYEQARDVYMTLQQRGGPRASGQEVFNRSTAMLVHCDKALAELSREPPSAGQDGGRTRPES